MTAPAHSQRWLAELQTFVAFPTVSAQASRYGTAMQDCAHWLAGHLQRKIGLQKVSLEAGAQFPIVVGEWRGAGSRAPTVLIYGHYDVQPPEPLSAWRSPPFAPVLRGDYLYGRGASDDKGQLFIHLKALELLLRRDGRLPVNVCCVFEGAEEIGSPGLGDFLQKNRRQLRSDVALVSDMAMFGRDKPALTRGMRGVLYVELTLRHKLPDLHSGNFGGAVQTPLQALCRLVTELFEPNGRIAIEGFYDDMKPLSGAERREVSRMQHGSSLEFEGLSPGGETGYSFYARTALRPALTVCGVTGGYGGPGLKAVAPASARAKLDFRLAPGQDPGRVFGLLGEWVHRRLPAGMSFTLSPMMAVPAVTTPSGHPAVRAAQVALTEAFGRAPVVLRSGGTVPVVHLLHSRLGIPSVLMGFGLPDDGVHGPNERFYLPNFFRGIQASRRFLKYLADFSNTPDEHTLSHPNI